MVCDESVSDCDRKQGMDVAKSHYSIVVDQRYWWRSNRKILSETCLHFHIHSVYICNANNDVYFELNEIWNGIFGKLMNFIFSIVFLHIKLIFHCTLVIIILFFWTQGVYHKWVSVPLVGVNDMQDSRLMVAIKKQHHYHLTSAGGSLDNFIFGSYTCMG